MSSRSLLLNRDDLRPGSNHRIQLIDVTRGLYVLWMIIAHALTIAGLPASHPLQWLRPPGWATTCFIMLSGFSVAAVFRPSKYDAAAARLKLWKRAGTLAAVAFLSNVAFKVAEAIVSGWYSERFLVDILTFRSPWSISAILLPISILVFCAPGLLRWAARSKPPALFGWITMIDLGVWFLVSHAPATARSSMFFQALFTENGMFSFPVGLFFLLGVWGFALGNLLVFSENVRRTSSLLLAGSAFVFAAMATPFLRISGLFFLRAAYRFIWSIIIGTAFLRYPSIGWLQRSFASAGRSALLLFIIHRPIIQVQNLFLAGLAPTVPLALILILTTTGACYIAAWLRFRVVRLGKALASLGF